MKELKIVYMNSSHLISLAELEEECFSEPWTLNGLKQELSNPNACFLVATINNETVGYIGCYYIVPEGFITNIAIFKQFRRKGIAKALLRDLFKFSKMKKIKSISLEVRASNSNAINLYKKVGLQKVGIRKNFYSLPREDAIIMTKWFNY